MLEPRAMGQFAKLAPATQRQIVLLDRKGLAEYDA
ncbi:hypothetical protein ACVIIV_006905 [Bradyrhizobium sp. USDA 4354]